MSERPGRETPPRAVPDLARYKGRPLRVLHGVYEIAGQGMMLAHALREWGCDARALSYQVAWDGRVSDLVVDLGGPGGEWSKAGAMLRAFVTYAPRFDLFHFHFGTSFFPRQLDLGALRAMGKKIVFHYHGCEIRHRAHMLKTHRLSTCTECDPFCRPRHQRALRARAARFADHAFYSTLDLAESAPGATQLPLAIETARWEAAASAHPLPLPERRNGSDGPVVIAHAPTNRLIKGTRHVVQAVETLAREFPRLELRMIEGQPWAAMPEFLSGCDILVDQLMMGGYGLLAIEGMAQGKAVVSYLRDDQRALHPDLPVVSAEPATLVEALRALIRDPARRADLGARGLAFARRVHDTRVVGEQLLRVYRRVLGLDPAERAAAPRVTTTARAAT